MNTETPKKTLVLNRKIKTVETNHVCQSFTHGRTKTVTVEVKKRRGVKKSESGNNSSLEVSPHTLVNVFSKQLSEDADDSLKILTERELEVRLKALKEAEERKKNEKLKTGSQSSDSDASDDDRSEDQNQSLAEEQKGQCTNSQEVTPFALAPNDTNVSVRAKYSSGKLRLASDEDDSDSKQNFWKKPVKKATREINAFGSSGKRQKKVSIYDAMTEEQERIRSLAAVRRARNKNKKKDILSEDSESKKIVREVIIPEVIEVQELANRMAIRAGDLIKSLFKLGVVATINQVLDGDTAELVVSEFGHKIKRVSESDVEEGLSGDPDDPKHLISRAPVVTIMGHVDHGKTSLLDALRKTDVAAKEAGGITQHIGAYQVKMPDGRKITFIDTPGHEAFTEMRVRGANITDVVVLVVAADDSVKEQTIEAINHARAAGVPIVVAINKIDKPNADPNKVKQDLLRHEIITESLGGEVVTVEVSAKTGKGLDSLSKAILVQAEMLDLKANPNRSGEGVVIESRQERGLGVVATILIKRGTLRHGDIFVSGRFSGRVRVMTDYLGNKVESASPAMPVEVIGFDGNPDPGADFVVLNDEAKAREIAQYRDKKARISKHAIASRNLSVEQMFDNLTIRNGIKELPLIIKADVQGSVEAIVSNLQKLSNDEVAVRVLHSSVGEITESDASLAKASNAMIIGFNVRASSQAKTLAQHDTIDIRYYSIIYDLIDDITARLSGLLAPELREKNLGAAEVRKVFDIGRVGKVAGCMVTSGIIRRGAKVRVLRDNIVIHEGELSSLMRMKDEVKEVKDNFECGVGIENYKDVREGDIIECFMIEEIKRKL